MIKKKRIALLVALFTLVALFLWQHNFILYGVSQGYGQLSIVWESRPVEEFLSDPSFPDSLKEKLHYIQQVRAYAIDSLGVNDSKNYTTVFDQKGKPVLWVVTACMPYRFKPREWSYPFLGNMPYKGFFNRESASKEEKILKKQGYDTNLSEVSGWSTLGWFRDPILSGMLYKSEGDLASLIIHELTHSTLFIKDSVEYNENLATFVGEKGALKFMEYRYGQNTPHYVEYLQSLEDDKMYSDYILKGYDRLDSLYNTFTNSDNPTKKDSLKRKYITEIMKGVEQLPLYDPERYMRKRKHLPNNTYFMSFKRYNAKQDVFAKELEEKFHSDLKQYLKYFREKYPSL